MILKNSKILSIQSHVVSGYVGNKCCILPLQILGNDVDFINSVQLSNHPKYTACKGQILDSSDLKDLYEALKLNNLANYSHIITGYIGSKTFLEEVCNIVEDIKKLNPGSMFYCDPVMGDNGEMYVPVELLDIFREKVLPLADVLFPNLYELELLTKRNIKCEKDIKEAIDWFHIKGVKTVVVTSSDLSSDNILHGYVSKMQSDGSTQLLRMDIPKFAYSFYGTGDLFASLFLGWSLKFPDNIQIVCSKVIGSIQAVLQNTVEKYESLSPFNDSNLKYKALELQIVQSISDIINPVSFPNIIQIN